MHTGEAGGHTKKPDALAVTSPGGPDNASELSVLSPQRKAKKLESADKRHGSSGCSLRIQGAHEHVHTASLHLATILSATHSHED